MKKQFYFWSLAALVALCTTFTSCSKDDDESGIEDVEKIVTVGLKADGELAGSETPLSTDDLKNAPTASRALWGVQVCVSPTNPNDYMFMGAQKVAFGVFDDLTKFSVELSTTKKYYVEVTYIPNGKDVIHCFTENKKWASPFTTSLTTTIETPINEIVYHEGDGLPMLASGRNTPIGEGDSYTNAYYNEVDRFYGFVPAYEPTEGGTITVDMKRTVFGLTFNAKKVTGVNYESLLIKLFADQPTYAKSHTLTVSSTDEVSQLVIPFICLRYLDDAVMSNSYVETIKISIGTTEKPDLIFYGDINVKRNTMHTYNFNMVGDDVSNSAINANFNDGAMGGESKDLN